MVAPLTSRKSLLTSFSTQRSGVAASASSRTRVKQRAASAIITTSSYNTFDDYFKKPDGSGEDDTIDRLASMLLNDTTIHVPLDQTNESSPSRHTGDNQQEVTSKSPFELSHVQKPVSDGQDLSFVTGDDSMHFNGHSLSRGAMNVDGNVAAQLSDDFDNYPPPIPRQSSHVRRGSGPPIPRKSSKRLSVQQSPLEHSSQQDGHGMKEYLEFKADAFSSNKHLHGPSTPIRRAPTNSLRYGERDAGKSPENLLTDSEVVNPSSTSPRTPNSANRSRIIFNSNKILTKVRNAFSGLWSDKAKTSRESIGLNILTRSDNEEDPRFASSSQARRFEGAAFNNSKIETLPGHNKTNRRPLVVDELESLRHRASAESLTIRANAEVPWHFSHPGRVSPAHRSRSDLRKIDTNETPIKLKDIQNGLNAETPRHSKEGSLGRLFDFDALLDTPPQGASTPRLRLEPSFERNGKKKLINVAANSPSMFDPGRTSAINDNGTDTDDVDDERESPSQRRSARRSLLDAIKRRNSQLKDAGMMMKRRISHSHPVTKKKHPSPSKEYLDELSHAFEAYARAHGGIASAREDEENQSAPSVVGLGIQTPLASKDSNIQNQQATKLSPKGKEAVILNTPAKPIRGPSGKSSQPRPSKIPRPVGQSRMTPREQSRFQLGENTLNSRLATGASPSLDELQWDESRYQIGMKKIKG